MGAVKEPQGCVYEIRCLIGTRRGYVGQHCTLIVEKRWAGHRYGAVSGSKFPIYRAMRKYGIENFEFRVVWTGPRSKLNEKETYYIKKLGTFIDDPRGGGYNLTTGGGANGSWAEVVRRRISKSGRGKKRSPETRAKLKALAQNRPPMSKATRVKIGESNFGRIQSDEACEKISAALKGVPKSEEACANMSKSAKKKWTKEHREYISSLLTGRKMSEGTCDAMSRAQILRFEDPAERAVIGAHTARRWQNEDYRAEMCAMSKRVAQERGPETWLCMHKPEARAKNAAANRGKKRTPAQRAVQSEAAFRRWVREGKTLRVEYKRTPETRANMSAARSATWASKGPEERRAIFDKASGTRTLNKLLKEFLAGEALEKAA